MSESNHFEKIESKASRLIAGKENKNLSNSSTLNNKPIRKYRNVKRGSAVAPNNLDQTRKQLDSLKLQLDQKKSELKKLCLREYQLTASVPPEMPPLEPNEAFPPLVRSIASYVTGSSQPPAPPPRAPRSAQSQSTSQSLSSAAPPVPAYSHPKPPAVNRLPRRGSAHSHSQPQLQAVPIGPERERERERPQTASRSSSQQQQQQQQQQTQRVYDSPRSRTTSSSDSPRAGTSATSQTSVPLVQPQSQPQPPAHPQSQLLQAQAQVQLYHHLQTVARVSQLAPLAHPETVGLPGSGQNLPQAGVSSSASGVSAPPAKYVIKPPPAPPSDAIRPPSVPAPAALGSLNARANPPPQVAVPEASYARATGATSSAPIGPPSPRLAQGASLDSHIGSGHQQQQQQHQAPEPFLMRTQFITNKALIGWYMELRRQTLRPGDKLEGTQQMGGSGGSSGSLASSAAAQEPSVLNPFSPFADFGFTDGVAQQADEEEDDADDVDAAGDDRRSAHSLETQNSAYSAPEMAYSSPLQFRVPTREDYAPSSSTGAPGAQRLQEQQRYASTGALPRTPARQDVPLAVTPTPIPTSGPSSSPHAPATRKITAPRVLPPGARFEEKPSPRSSQEEPDVPLGSTVPPAAVHPPGPQLSPLFSADATQRARALGYLPDAQSQHWYQSRELSESSAFQYAPSNQPLQQSAPPPGQYLQSSHYLPGVELGGPEEVHVPQVQPYARQQAYNLDTYLAGLSLSPPTGPQPSSHPPGTQSGMQYDRSKSAANNFARANRD